MAFFAFKKIKIIIVNTRLSVYNKTCKDDTRKAELKMTKSQIFIKAHKIARRIAEEVGDYMIALSFALKSVYKDIKDSFIDPNYRQFDLIASKLVRNGDYSMAEIWKGIGDSVVEFMHKNGAYYGFYVYADFGKKFGGLRKIAKVFISEILWDEAA